MTSLSGEFQTDLSIDDAMVACTDAIDGLNWRIETVESDRIVAFSDSDSEHLARIEVGLSEAGKGSEFRIIGSDSEQDPLEEDELVSVLDRARDAINGSMERSQRQDPGENQREPSPATKERQGDDERRPERQQAKSAAAAAEERSPQGEGTAAAIPAKFRSLQLIASIYGALGWLVAVLGPIAVIAATASANGSDVAVTLIGGLLGVAFYALLLFGIAAAIRLALAVEENTRNTVALLKARNDLA